MNQEWKIEYAVYKKHYEDFQKEVHNYINNLVDKHENAIHIVSVTQRPNHQIKNETSIEANIHSKKYKNLKTILDIKDIAGVRVKCHCEDDVENIFTLLEGELMQRYSNVERKLIGGRESEHPYRAVHLTFAKQLEENEKISNIFCEIQIRTIMADAWAVQNHKYLYKNRVEGEAHELTSAVSEIMNGCEKLWSLVKKKALQKEGKDYTKEITEIHRKAETDLRLVQENEEKIKALNDWFKSNKTTASNGMQKLGIKTFMEVEVKLPALDLDIKKKILRENASRSTIRTFGWPIGVFLGNRKEFAPKADQFGIHAEIAIKEESIYDYWAIHSNGAFYLKKSLYEEKRKPDQIFFNTRIVRITEVFMYIKNLYSSFSVPSNAKIQATIRHGGLKGRVLSSSSPNRSLSIDYKTETDEVLTTVETTIDEINSNMVDIVENYTKPLFERFEFFELSKSVLEDIVVNYLNGKVA